MHSNYCRRIDSIFTTRKVYARERRYLKSKRSNPGGPAKGDK
jgi:hypothetical protein